MLGRMIPIHLRILGAGLTLRASRFVRRRVRAHFLRHRLVLGQGRPAECVHDDVPLQREVAEGLQAPGGWACGANGV